jgi:hypothetical protein
MDDTCFRTLDKIIFSYMVWNVLQAGVYASSATRLEPAYYAAVNTIVLLRSVEVVYTMPKERKSEYCFFASQIDASLSVGAY